MKTKLDLKILKTKAPDGATHYNFNGTIFPYEKHEQNDMYVMANGRWELTNVPSCAIPISSEKRMVDMLSKKG